MRYEYDPNLVEQATFLAARGHSEKECALHELLDPLYKFSDPELRQRAFREAYGELFRRFGLEQVVPSHVRRFDLITLQLGRCVVREAERSRAQCVDLYRENPEDSKGTGGRVLILALSPESILDEARLGPWLLRQLQHVEDMLDDRFAYECELPGDSAMQRNLIRDRYAVLWDIFVESRLSGSGMVLHSDMDAMWRTFTKAFTRAGRDSSRAVFEKLWSAERLTHGQLLAWATDPNVLLEADEEGRNELNTVESAFAETSCLNSVASAAQGVVV